MSGGRSIDLLLWVSFQQRSSSWWCIQVSTIPWSNLSPHWREEILDPLHARNGFYSQKRAELLATTYWSISERFETVECTNYIRFSSIAFDQHPTPLGIPPFQTLHFSSCPNNFRWLLFSVPVSAQRSTSSWWSIPVSLHMQEVHQTGCHLCNPRISCFLPSPSDLSTHHFNELHSDSDVCSPSSKHCLSGPIPSLSSSADPNKLRSSFSLLHSISQQYSHFLPSSSL